MNQNDLSQMSSEIENDSDINDDENSDAYTNIILHEDGCLPRLQSIWCYM